MPPRLPALYAILDVERAAQRSLDPLGIADVWLDAGVRLLQLRAKTLAGGAFLRLAEAIARKSKAAGATFIVNDRADIAAACGASGVHLGQDDLAPSDVVGLLPPGAVIGLSTHNRAQLIAARDQPVGYIAIGPVFDTQSKTNPDPVVGLEGVREAVALAGGMPVVAIGGITLDTAPRVLAAGASSVAIIADLFRDDAAERIAGYLALG